MESAPRRRQFRIASILGATVLAAAWLAIFRYEGARLGLLFATSYVSLLVWLMVKAKGEALRYRSRTAFFITLFAMAVAAAIILGCVLSLLIPKVET